MVPNNIRGALLGGCAVAALVLGASHGAQAQTQVYGGGSTLAAKIYDQLFLKLQTSLESGISWNYAAVGSGAGARGVLCNSGGQVPITTDLTGATVIPTVTPTTVHFGASDNPLSATQINDWNNSTNITGGGSSPDCSQTPTGSGGLNQAGPILQIATFGTPITIPFNLTPVSPAGQLTKNGSMTLNDTQLCGIFSGKIVSWSDSALTGIVTTVRRGVTTPATLSGPITVVYRSDGSGTSALFTAHLAAVCTKGGNSNISFTSTQTFANLFNNATLGNPAMPSNWIGASGSGNVQANIGPQINGSVNNGNGTSGSIGYLSPDYTQAAPATLGGKFPPVAYLVNQDSGSTTPVPPDYTNTTAALATFPLASDLSKGTNYVPARARPNAGYPIAGYTTMIMPVCYSFANNNVVNALYDFIGQTITASVPDYVALLQSQGFVQISGALQGAINDNIVNNNNGYNIDLQDANICQGAGATGPGTFAGR